MCQADGYSSSMCYQQLKVCIIYILVQIYNEKNSITNLNSIHFMYLDTFQTN